MKSKHFLKISFALVMFIAFFNATAQQGTAINTSGAAADASAILDISSTSQGLLIPRMTASERGAVSGPAEGLMVYQTDAVKGFYYYTGAAWTYIGGDNLGNHTAGDSLDMANYKIKNLATCTANLDAANKLYVDNIVAAGGGGVGATVSMVSNQSPSAMTYANAVNYCNTLNESSYTDWFMPARDELKLFMGVGGATSDSLWTSTLFEQPYFFDNYTYQTIRLDNGDVSNGGIDVRPVLSKSAYGTTASGAGVWLWQNNVASISPPAGTYFVLTYLTLYGTAGSTSCKMRYKITYNDATVYNSAEFPMTGTGSPYSVNITLSTPTILPVNKSISTISFDAYYHNSAYLVTGSVTVGGYEVRLKQNASTQFYARCVR